MAVHRKYARNAKMLEQSGVTNESFIEALARPQPNPGGGAAAAYAASLALALLEKIALLELGRYERGDSEAQFWEHVLIAGRSLGAAMERLRYEDVQAYAKLSKALASPQRATELPVALRDAINCPMEIMEKARESLLHISECGKLCKKHLISDLLVASELLRAAINGAYYIAYANLNLVLDARDRSGYEANLTEAADRCRATFTQVIRQLASRLGAPYQP
jgi:methenyltetrahydrofolate cyclohydrolase